MMRIKLAENFRAVFYAPFYAAHELGCYAREGVEVELIGSPAPAFAASGLLDGTIDLSWGGPMRVMKARDTEPSSDLVCFCEVATRDPFFLVGRAQGSEFRFTDLPKLKFAKVTEVPTPWLCLQLDLREQGVDPARLNCAADGTMLSNLEKLRSGELDVVQMFEPYASLAVKAGAGEILYAASTRGPTSYTTFLATRDGIERNRDAFLAMTRAHSAHAALARGAQRGGPGASHRSILPGDCSGYPRDLAGTLSQCRSVVVTRPPCRAAGSRGSRKACFPAVSSPAGRYTRTASIRACAEKKRCTWPPFRLSLSHDPNAGVNHNARSDHSQRRCGDAARRRSMRCGHSRRDDRGNRRSRHLAVCDPGNRCHGTHRDARRNRSARPSAPRLDQARRNAAGHGRSRAGRAAALHGGTTT